MLYDTCPLDENIVTQIYVPIREAIKYFFLTKRTNVGGKSSSFVIRTITETFKNISQI